MTGADFQPMLYLTAERRYIWLSHGAANLLDALDGATTTAQILTEVNGGGDPELEARRREAVLRTIDGLRRAGAFTLDAGRDTVPAPARWRRWFAANPRLKITRGIEPLVTSPARLAVRHARGARLTLVALLMASLTLCIAGLVGFSTPTAIAWPAVFGILLFEVAVHELSHATVCKVFGVAVREAGVMLWGWFLPLAYVDCTDIYRLPTRRPRVLVALAGPCVDLVAAGAAAAVALTATGEVSGTATIVFLSLLLMLARNLTPLLPTDGYHAMEALTGELNLRRRAWSHLRAWLADHSMSGRSATGAEGPGRARRHATGNRRHSVYAAYGAVTALYMLATLALVVFEVRGIAHLLA
ncbi:MAG: M50 family metallopeptidase [Solirubrobacterales bacterium]|nr:M50 family metallopeptidase [Solirubrobacterales bacterium]